MVGRKPTIRPIVVAYLLKHAGKPVTALDMARDTGLTLEQIQGQMRYIIADGLPVQVITRAQIWKYEPESETAPEPEPEDVTGELFECIGRTRSGTPVVRDGNGVLYLAQVMDV